MYVKFKMKVLNNSRLNWGIYKINDDEVQIMDGHSKREVLEILISMRKILLLDLFS